MKNLMVSELIAKDVLSIENCQNLGYVLDCCFDKDLTRLLGFVVADEESECENFLPRTNIKIFGEDCLFIENPHKQDLNFSGFSFNPIGKKVYDDKGCFLGRVIDLEISKNKPSKIITSICEIPVCNIYSCGEDCLLFSAKKKKKINKTNKFNFASDGLLPKVETQNYAFLTENNISKYQITDNKSIQNFKQDKVTLAPTSLLNKTATCDIYGLNNELIIREGQVINQAKIDKAKKHGKINLLIINSK